MTRIEAITAADYRALPLECHHKSILHSGEAVDRLNVILSDGFEGRTLLVTIRRNRPGSQPGRRAMKIGLL